MDNKVFFIRYLENPAVKVETHITPSKTRRDFPLADVADLIQAATEDSTRRLLGLPVEYGPLTLKFPNGTALDGNVLLSTINSAVHGTFSFPLVITSATDGITLNEYLQTIPPLPNYSDNLPGPSSTVHINFRHPQLTSHWQNFEEEVVNFIQTVIVQNPDRVIRPQFPYQLVVNNEVPSLQSCVAQNLFNVVAMQFNCVVWPTERGPTIIGNPDGYIEKDNQKILVYEIKINSTLNPDWFQNGRIDVYAGEERVLTGDKKYLRNAINQVYTYMVWNHLQYGILSSFDYNFFLKRDKVQNASDGLEELLISTGISQNSTNPTILQSLAYFMSLADGVPFKPPPPSPLRVSPRTSRTTSARNSPRTSRTPTVSEPFPPDHSENNSEPQYALDDFSIKSVLGQGRTKVYYEAKQQMALKAIDLYKQSSMIDELKHEIEVYNALSDLQGIYIPTLRLHGFYEGGMYCIGLSLCGTVPEKLEDNQKQRLLLAMDLIHSKGILHNDIKRENILVDQNGNPYIIDFGFATMNTALDAQNEEKAQLRTCIENF